MDDNLPLEGFTKEPDSTPATDLDTKVTIDAGFEKFPLWQGAGRP
jgi:hypothetical protein